MGGELQVPGWYPISSSVTLKQLLDISGGPTVLADISRLEIQKFYVTDGGQVNRLNKTIVDLETISSQKIV